MMLTKKQKWCSLLLAGICCLAVLNGCGAKHKSDSGDKSAAEDTQKDTDLIQETAEAESTGSFTMTDIMGQTYTQEMFADYDLTLINVFATWCTPCVNEIPDLEKLRSEMADQGVNVVGIVLDAIDGLGRTDETVVEKAKFLAEQTGAEYPFLIPDEGYLNGRLSGISVIPETFFVDREGKYVGKVYTGSRSLEEWKTIVEEELKGVVQ